MFQLNPHADFNMLALFALFSDSVSSPAFSPCSLKLSTSLKPDPTESLLKADGGKFLYLCYPIAFSLHPPSLLISLLEIPLWTTIPLPKFHSNWHTHYTRSQGSHPGPVSVLPLLGSWVGFWKLRLL